jgi:hypothetical protein
MRQYSVKADLSIGFATIDYVQQNILVLAVASRG